MPQREPALLWLRDCALTAVALQKNKKQIENRTEK